MSDFVCLYFGPEGECPDCGGSVDAVKLGGFVGAHGLLFCSEDCAADYEEREAR